MIRRYIQVTKPGIIMGNAISVAGGFLLAAQGQFTWTLLLATLAGLSLVVAGGCAINNVIDRDIDAAMKRTQSRPTVTGAISSTAALSHGVVLTLAGFILLGLFTNISALAFAVFGFVIYVGVYSLYMKRHSVYGTLVGSLSGAVPPVVGYCASAGQVDAGAIILLLMFSLWQMPHSYAIAIFRYQDYARANIPVLPVKQGIHAAKCHIVIYIAIYALVTLMLSVAGYTGIGYMAVAGTTSFWWLLMALRGYRRNINLERWAKQVFAFSIINITLVSAAMAFDYHSVVVG